MSRHKVVVYLGVVSALLMGLLWAAALWSGASWFPMPVLPAVLYGLAFPWGMALLIRYAPVNRWLRAAGCLGAGAVLMLTVNPLLDRLAGPGTPGRLHGLGFQFDFTNWADPWVFSENINMIVTLALAAAALICAAFGACAAAGRRERAKRA